MVVIIILNYNQSKMTLECVDSILKSKYKNFKLMVVDNGSTIEEFNYLKKNVHRDVLIKRIENNSGYVGGVNFGLSEGKMLLPDYFLIMNNDTIIDNEAVGEVVAAAERYKNNAIISGKIYHFDKPNVIQRTGSFFSDRRYLKEEYPGLNEEDIGQLNEEKERDMLDDIFWLIPKKVFKEVGYYSDNFYIYSEQGDYALRAVKKGFKLIYTPKAKIWHKGSVTTGDGDELSPAVNFWRNKGGVIYLYRNINKKYFYLNLTKTIMKLSIKNILNYLNLRKSNNKRSDLASLVGCLYGVGWIINKQPDNGYNPFINKL